MTEIQVNIEPGKDKLQEKIEELELRVKGILGAIPAGVVFITTQGMVEATTPRFEQMLALPPQEIVGQGLSRFIDCSLNDAELARRLAEGVGQLIRAKLITGPSTDKSKNTLDVYISADLIDTAEGVGLMLCVLDAAREVPL